jgi:hypothetical protein
MPSFSRSLLFIFSLLLAIFLPFLAWGAMSSTNYQIRFDSVGVGGVETSTSSSYKVRDSLEFIQGTSSSSSYRVDQGYRGGVYDPVVHFNVISQDTASQVAATAITSTSVDVTVTTGYVTGDYIVVLQNEGLSQVAAMGRITSVAGSTLNVDFFQYASSLPVIDGSNDYVYELTGSSIPLASLSPSTVSTGIIGWEVAADVPTGYSVFVMENQNLQTAGGDVLNDVDDGAVTAEMEEYGGRSSDTTLSNSTFDTLDTAFTTTLQQVASRTVATLKARDFLTLKAAAAETTVNGAYSHTLTVVFVGNY